MAAPKLKYALGNSASTTLSSGITNTDTTAPLTSSTNFQSKSGAGMALLDEGQATEELAYSTGLSGSNLTIPLANRGLEGGSAQAHSSSTTVKGIFTAGMWNDMIDSLVNAFVASSGALDTTKVVDLNTAQTMTNKTFGANGAATKALTFGLSGATAGKTMTIASSHTNDRTITLPDATDTVAVLGTAQTFTATQTEKQILYTNNAITASGNAATVPITHRYHTVTNNSAATLTITLTTTSATNGQLVMIEILDFSAAAQTITWVNTENSTVTAPTTSNGSTTLPLTVAFKYNSATSKWRCIASS